MRRSPSLPRSWRTRAVGIAAAGLMVAGVAACGPQLAGSAAIVGEQRLTEAQLGGKTDQISQLVGIPASAAINQLALQRWIQSELAVQLGEKEGITVSDGEVDNFIATEANNAGSLAQLIAILNENGYVEEEIRELARVTLVLGKVGEKIAPEANEMERNLAVAIELESLAAEEGVQVNPRFGTWIQATLQVSPPENTLSVPAPAENPFDIFGAQ